MLDLVRIRVPRLQGSWRGKRLEDEVDVRLPQLAALLPTLCRMPKGRLVFSIQHSAFSIADLASSIASPSGQKKNV